MEEVKSGFRKSQLVDTQIISKYAFHFLKTFFNTVEVQKGGITAEFRKIFGVQEVGTEKDRSKHSHHAKDAIVLTLIPTPAIREQMLTTWYEIQETKDLLLSNTEPDKNKIQEEIYRLEETLRLLKYQCNLPNVNAIIDKVDEQILINNISKDNALVAANKRIRSRGKVVAAKDENGNPIYQTDENGSPIQRKHKDGNLVWKNDEFGKPMFDKNGNKIPVFVAKEMWAKGDAIRGQLHKDSFLGAIKLVKKDEKGQWLKKENGEYEFEDLKYVIREELVYKKNPQSPGFKDLEDLKNQIIDKSLFNVIELQVKAVGDFREALTQGIWMTNKKGEQVHKIRRVRIEVSATNPIALKEQTYKNAKPSTILSDRKHKEQYWAVNGENIILALYQNTIPDKENPKEN
jgi:CRISPR-associated endonuclease Csn1